MRINTRSITLAATLTALCAVTGLIPYVFFLPVAVAATTLSIGMTAFVGLAFGCISLLYCFTVPMSPVALAFVQAPYIPIVPRVLAAVGAFGVCALMKKFVKQDTRVKRTLTAAVPAATASLFNTALVVGLLVLVMPNADLGGVTVLLYVPTMLISGAIEFVCMAVLTPPISLTLDRVVLNGKRKKAPPVSDEDLVTSGIK